MIARKMKIFPACFAAVALTACSISGTSAQTETDSTSSSEQPAFQTAVFYYDYSDAYGTAIRAALSHVMNEEELFFREYNAESNQTTQTSQLEEAILQGADLLLVNVVSSGSTYTGDELCLLADKADIPLVFFNRCPEADGDEGIVLGYYDDVALIGTDPKEAGHMQGWMIGDYLLEHYDEVDLNGDGVISYALFKGESNNTEAIYRTKYSVEDANAMLEDAGYPDLQYFDSTSVDNYQLDMTGRWAADSSQSYMATNLLTYSLANNNMIELIISNNDDMADGAIRALNAFGMNLGTGDCITIPVFGVDATSTAKQLIREGKMTGTVMQDPEELAQCIVKIVKNVRDGKELLDGLDEYQRDEEHNLNNKIFLPYTIYEPEAAAGSTESAVTGS